MYSRRDRRDFRDMAAAHVAAKNPPMRAFGPRPIPQHRPGGYSQIVDVTNYGSDDWRQWDIICVASPQGVPTGNPPDFTGWNPASWFSGASFVGYRLDENAVGIPTIDWWHKRTHILGVTQEPIARGATGSVCIRGITPALHQAHSIANADEDIWLYVAKVSGRWTFRLGRNGDARLLKYISKSAYSSGDLPVLVDLCEIPNHRVVGGAAASSTPANTFLADITPTDTTQLWDPTVTWYASPGWTTPAGSPIWLREITEEWPVLLRTTYPGYGPAGPVLNSGTIEVRPLLPGLCVTGFPIYDDSSDLEWCVRDLITPFWVRADGAWTLSGGLHAYLYDFIQVYDGGVHNGVTYPLVRPTVNFRWSPAQNFNPPPPKNPNVQDQQVFRCVLDPGYARGESVLAYDDMMDDPIGTVKMWISNGTIPPGWREYTGLQGRFPVGYKAGDSDFGTFNNDGGAKTHSHGTGSTAGASSGASAGVAASHLPPYHVLIFIERYQ
jgi:hypothetical protein